MKVCPQCLTGDQLVTLELIPGEARVTVHDDGHYEHPDGETRVNWDGQYTTGAHCNNCDWHHDNVDWADHLLLDPKLDLASSDSRQHYIDTGDYLRRKDAYGHCDTCGSPCNESGCLADHLHIAALG